MHVATCRARTERHTASAIANFCWPRRNEGMAAKFGDGVRRTINSARWWCWQRQQLKELMKTSGEQARAATS